VNDATLKMQAAHAAARVNSNKVGFDPLTILTILTTVLPLLTQCWNRNDEPNATMSHTNLKRYHASHPEQLLRRTARRIRAESDQPMTKDASFELARAVIEQALSADPETVAACCGEAG
jgi:hypothetical protein